MQFDKSMELRQQAHQRIPGGCHTYAKGDDQYPLLSPGFISHGLGSRVWDVDGNEFIEYGQGNRSVGLGHVYPAVVQAVQRELFRGANFSRPSTIEVQAADALLSLVPNADMVKFCKDGSDATTAALKIARAYTGRDYIAYCRDQPFFATNDWFIGTTAIDAGIPPFEKSLSLGFGYDDLASLQSLFVTHPGKIACVIIEAAKYMDPSPGFPECRSRHVPCKRGVVHHGRNDHRFSMAQWWRTSLLRHRSRSVMLGKSSCQWLCRFSACRKAKIHGTGWHPASIGTCLCAFDHSRWGNPCVGSGYCHHQHI